MRPRIELKELADLHKGCKVTNNKLVNIRGCNGSGKSTIPIMMMNTDPYSFEVTWIVEGKERVIATVFPSYNYAALGKYSTACGGMDSMKTTDEIKSAVNILWNLNYNLIMEGIMASTVRQTYIDLFTQLNQVHKLQREIIIYNLLPPLQVCLDRIQIRNGGKPIKEEQVASKWATVEKNVQYFEDAGFTCIVADNSDISKDETIDWFFNMLGTQKPAVVNSSEKSSPVELKQQENKICSTVSKDTTKIKDKGQRIKALPKYTGPVEELYLPTTQEISGYEWAEFYKEPDENVVINWENMRFYWYWIAERMNIWYKRTILRESQPWTDDKILQQGKFTNAIRDLDKGTIYYIKNILSKIDDPFDDFEKRTKEVILNTMIYRLFIKRETVDAIGFIYLDTWKEQWGKAKENLRAIRKSGEPVFHSAYYVFGLQTASPSPDNHDKTENAINLIENFWLPKLDEIYANVKSMNMKDLLDYLSTLCCVGRFTAYEWVCDWALCHRHTKNKIVDWTDDSYVNIGPGNKRGLDFIFEQSGNLSDIEKDMYLRATWRYYMKKYGFYDQFIEQLPDFMNGDINLRVIEHDCCELSKYLSVHYGIGKLKGKFTNDSKNNLDCLMI